MIYRTLIIASSLSLVVYLIWRIHYTYTHYKPYLLFYAISEFIILTSGVANTYFVAWRKFDKFEQSSVNLSSKNQLDLPLVDIFLLTCGEPFYVVKESIQKILNIDYPLGKKRLVVCDDGKSSELQDYIERLQDNNLLLNIVYKNRAYVFGHAKAGNINDAISMNSTEGYEPDFLLVLDADMQCERTILIKLLTPFYVSLDQIDEQLSFVQSPQLFRNVEKFDILGQQYKYFYNVIMKSWTSWGCTPCCGTNVLFRYKHLKKIGGFQYGSVTEDFLTSLVLHSEGFRSTYVSENLAIGLAPFDLCAFYKQRFRWAIGSLQILQTYFKRFSKLTGPQRWIYFNASLYIITTPILIYLASNSLLNYFFIREVFGSSWYIYFFGPFVVLHFLVLLILYYGVSYLYLIRSFQESIYMVNCYLLVLIYWVLRLPYSFQLTPKKGKSGHILSLLWCMPYIFYYVCVCILTLKVHDFSDIINLIWIFIICFQMLPPFTFELYKSSCFSE